MVYKKTFGMDTEGLEAIFFQEHATLHAHCHEWPMAHEIGVWECLGKRTHAARSL